MVTRKQLQVNMDKFVIFIVVESSWMGFPEPNVKHEVVFITYTT